MYSTFETEITIRPDDIDMNNPKTNMPIPINEAMYFKAILPTNIRIIQVANRTAAVEKFAGKIKAQVISTGSIIGINADLKSLILSCLIDNARATNRINASLARSDVWKDKLIIGSVSQRLASLRFVPIASVNSSNGIATAITMLANLA